VSKNSNNKKILVICQHFWPEGFRINDVADYFVENNCDVDVLCGIPNYPEGKFFDGYSIFKQRKQVHKNINIHRALEIPRGSNINLRVFLNYISFPLASLFHIPRLLTKRYDKIYIHQLSPVMMGLAGIIVGRLKKTETTMYVLDLWPENLYSVLPVKNKALRWLATKHSHWYYKRADKLVALSASMQTKLLQATGKPKERIIVLPQACEKVYESVVHDKTLKSRLGKGFNILFAGNISPAQSFETIIESAKSLQDQGIEDINWIIVGDGMSRTWLEEEVKKNGLSDCFYFEGHKPITDIPKYTDIADVLVGCLVKSDFLEATIPGKVMSYIAAGKPMVLAMDGEVQELINNTIKCGFVGPTEDVDKFTANIIRIHNMTKYERQAMGKKGRAYHFKHLERNIVLKQLYNYMFG